MKIKFQLVLACVLILGGTGYAQIPGFLEKWRVDLGTTNGSRILGLGRDGATLVQSTPEPYAIPSEIVSYDWISPSGEVIGRIPSTEFDPYESLVVVLVLRSNLVFQSRVSVGGKMQITQCSRSGGTVQITKTQLSVAWTGVPSSNRDLTLSDLSCPERLMFVQQGTVLICYRPAADMTNAFTSLTVGNVSQGNAQLLVTSSQGGQLQLQGSTNLNNWQSITNVQTVPGVNKVIVPAPDNSRHFYRGVSQ